MVKFWKYFYGRFNNINLLIKRLDLWQMDYICFMRKSRVGDGYKYFILRNWKMKLPSFDMKIHKLRRTGRNENFEFVPFEFEVSQQ